MNGLMGFVFLILGIIMTASPYTGWYLSTGWRFKDAEPSDTALFMNRVSGVIGVIVGLVLLVSSCSSMFTGGADTRWEKKFQERLALGEVSDISFGMINEIVLTGEERTEVVEMIQASKMESFDPGSSYAASGTGYITFQNGEKVDVVLFGNSGGIELHPNGTNKAFRIKSPELESWIRTHVTNGW